MLICEYDALIENGTWELVELQPHFKLIGNKGVYRVKKFVYEGLDKYKSRLVAKGFHQKVGIDIVETFSPVTKYTTVHIVFTLVLIRIGL